jgi:hypothetical protein
MRQRSPVAVLLLPFVTFGIYYYYWLVSAKTEINRAGANIPTAWLLIIPFVNIWWLWKFSEGVEHVTGGKQSTVISFILLELLGSIGQAILQHDFNTYAAGGGGQVGAPIAPPSPVQTATPQSAAQPMAQPAAPEQPPTTPTI